MYELAFELGINDVSRSKEHLLRLIMKKLTGTQGLVTLNESDYLLYDVLKEIYIIQDETNVSVP